MDWVPFSTLKFFYLKMSSLRKAFAVPTLLMYERLERQIEGNIFPWSVCFYGVHWNYHWSLSSPEKVGNVLERKLMFFNVLEWWQGKRYVAKTLSLLRWEHVGAWVTTGCEYMCVGCVYIHVALLKLLKQKKVKSMQSISLLEIKPSKQVSQGKGANWVGVSYFPIPLSLPAHLINLG